MQQMKNAFCISKQVISGARFLRLSATAQSLYMHLNADADDDGVVEAFATINKVRANEQDLIQLVQSGFLVILNQNELIAYITDWVRNNKGLDIRWHIYTFWPRYALRQKYMLRYYVMAKKQKCSQPQKMLR